MIFFTVLWTVLKFPEDDQLLVVAAKDLERRSDAVNDLKIEEGAECLGKWSNGNLYDAIILSIYGKEIEYLISEVS
tara:strand:+ start:359 stop:586 length:228 start_codon:yes stop_codon:yes gene_type:complete